MCNGTQTVAITVATSNLTKCTDIRITMVNELSQYGRMCLAVGSYSALLLQSSAESSFTTMNKILSVK